MGIVIDTGEKGSDERKRKALTVTLHPGLHHQARRLDIIKYNTHVYYSARV
jgi:hypothetical protein